MYLKFRNLKQNLQMFLVIRMYRSYTETHTVELSVEFIRSHACFFPQ